jgi:hypothetical protein
MVCSRVANPRLPNRERLVAISCRTTEAPCGARRPGYRRVLPSEAAWRASSGGATFVVVMQTADVWNWDDRAAGWRLGHPRDWRILVQREVSAPVVIVGEVPLQVALQRALVQHNDVIEALASEGANHALNERILPGTTRRRQHFFDAHLLHGTPRVRSVNRITIPDDEARRGVPRPRFAELLAGSRRRRVRRDIHVDNAASIVRQHHEHKQHAEGGGGNREEVDRGELGDVIGQERAPRLRGRVTATPEVLPTVACATSIPSFCNSPWSVARPRAGSLRASGESTPGGQVPATAARRGGVATSGTNRQRTRDDANARRVGVTICMAAANSARRLRATPRPADRSDKGAAVSGWPIGAPRVDAGARELPPRARAESGSWFAARPAGR